jgi:AcrR family transcriptional regulator
VTRIGLTPSKLVVAGAELADTAGFEAVTMSALARHFGVKTASLYSNISSSADLKANIAVLALEELAEQAHAALAGRAGRDALLAFANAYRNYAAEHPGRYAATRFHLPPHLVETGVGRAHAELTFTILRGYGLEGVDATHAVRLIGSILHGFTDLELSGGFAHSAPPSEESWLRIIEALDAMLNGW